MNGSKDGGPAFPKPNTDTEDSQAGMSLRDYFAAKAITGTCSWHRGASATEPIGAIARRAYDLADALLKAREA